LQQGNEQHTNEQHANEQRNQENTQWSKRASVKQHALSSLAVVACLLSWSTSSRAEDKQATAGMEVRIVDGDRTITAPVLTAVLGREGIISMKIEHVVGNESVRAADNAENPAAKRGSVDAIAAGRPEQRLAETDLNLAYRQYERVVVSQPVPVGVVVEVEKGNGAKILPDGVYRVRGEDSTEEGVTVKRCDTDGTVMLLDRLTNEAGPQTRRDVGW
jgi:hypothetical protein